MDHKRKKTSCSATKPDDPLRRMDGFTDQERDETLFMAGVHAEQILEIVADQKVRTPEAYEGVLHSNC